MHHYPRIFTLLLGAALLLTLPACDSGDDDGEGGGGNGNSIGDASATISGDYSESISGNAFFTVDEGEFAIGLFDGTLTTLFTGQVIVFGRSGGRPSPGTYTINDTGDEFTGGYVNYEGTDGDFTSATVITAESGTVTITSSSDERVVGSFSFTGTVANISNPGGGGTSTVEGTFSAQFIDPADAPDTGGL